MMQVIVGAHQPVLAFLVFACSAFGSSASTATTTPIPGSCIPPSLGAYVDISDCQGKVPPASCLVHCAVGYELSEANSSDVALAGGAMIYHCYSADDGFTGSGPECVTAPAPTPAPTSAPTSGTPDVSFTLELSMEVSNTSEFTLENEELKNALAQGIANGVDTIDGVEASNVEILSIDVANTVRRLGGRRLSSGRVTVNSEITGVPSSIASSDIKGAVSRIAQRINQELADMSLTVSDLTASVTVKEPVTAPTPAPVLGPEEPPSSRAETGFHSGSILALIAAIVMFRP